MNEAFMNLVDGIIYNIVEKKTKSIVFQDLFIVAYGNEITTTKIDDFRARNIRILALQDKDILPNSLKQDLVKEAGTNGDIELEGYLFRMAKIHITAIICKHNEIKDVQLFIDGTMSFTEDSNKKRFEVLSYNEYIYHTRIYYCDLKESFDIAYKIKIGENVTAFQYYKQDNHKIEVEKAVMVEFEKCVENFGFFVPEDYTFEFFLKQTLKTIGERLKADFEVLNEERVSDIVLVEQTI